MFLQHVLCDVIWPKDVMNDIYVMYEIDHVLVIGNHDLHVDELDNRQEP